MKDFEEIYHLYFHDVYLFILKLSRDEGIAEEITQETFFKALESIDQFKGNCKMSVWLCQIAKHLYFTYCNKQKRVEVDDYEDSESEHNLEIILLKKEESFRIHKVVHHLAEPYKEVFTLRLFGELSFKQIGELFEHTENWARVVFYRAKVKIQDALKEEST